MKIRFKTCPKGFSIVVGGLERGYVFLGVGGPNDWMITMNSLTILSTVNTTIMERPLVH